MTAEVIDLHRGEASVGDGFTVPPDGVLTSAVGKLNHVVIVGYEHDGTPYLASSHGAPETALMMVKALSELARS